MAEIVVPKLNNNDSEYVLTDWLHEDGARVEAGDPVAVVETSKAATEVDCPDSGFLRRTQATGSAIRPGDVLGRMVATPEEALVPADAAPAETGGPVVTNAARARADELGVTAEQLRGLGKAVVRAEDVDRLAAPEPAAADLCTLPRTQRGVAATVAESHRTIPAASAAIRVRVDTALRAARRIGSETGTLVGLPELLVTAVGRLRERFPLFFATPVDERTVRLARAAPVGVTVDVGTGRYVPVVRDAGTRTAADAAAELLEFRTRAMDGGFRADDLTGATIMVALHNNPDLLVASPIVHPGQTAVVCLAGTVPELALDDAGEVTVQRVAVISLGYDHRVLNGRDAVRFLEAVKAELEGVR